MVEIILKEYQRNAVKELIKYALELFKGGNGDNNIITLQSPTGSGKTIIVAKFIEDIIKEAYDENLCFLWISIGTGELHLQSKKKLNKIFNGFPRVSSLEEYYGDIIQRNDVVVVNWEKLRNKNKFGEWTNKLMRDGESINFIDMVQNTQKISKIILIIDESHLSVETDRSKELLEFIKPDAVLEMSATPNSKKQSVHICYVDPKEVIESGMIKKDIIVQKDIKELVLQQNHDAQISVIESAYNQRLYLKKLFIDEGSIVNPLCLIQLPTAHLGDEKLKIVREFLLKRDITEENGKLAIWLTDQKSDDLDKISIPTNAVEFLVFKQAINTGWDCPRAHVLVKLREPTMTAFEIQTVGRILRMPEQHFYKTDDLNIGYIYTDGDKIKISPYIYYKHLVKDVYADRINEYLNIDLNSYFKLKSYSEDEIGYDYKMMLFNNICLHFNLPNNKNNLLHNKQFLVETGVNFDIGNIPMDLLDEYKLKGGVEIKNVNDDIDRIGSWMNDYILQVHIDKQIISGIGSYSVLKESVPIVKECIIDFFKSYLGITSVIDIYKIVYNNRRHFKIILENSFEQYAKQHKIDLTKVLIGVDDFYIFNLQKKLHYCSATTNVVNYDKYAYNPCYLDKDRVQSERDFEEFINSIDSIIWWWKNGDYGHENFGIKYVYGKAIHVFYPDYIVRFKDGGIGLFEAKASEDERGLGMTKAKAEALYKYIVEHGSKFIGGVVIKRDNDMLIHDGEEYNWYKCEQNKDWSEWKDFKLVIKNFVSDLAVFK